MDLETSLELAQENEWDMSIDVDRIPKELLERNGPDIPLELMLPENDAFPGRIKRPQNYLSLFAYACLSLAVHGVALKTVDSPIHVSPQTIAQQQQQERQVEQQKMLQEYFDHYVPEQIQAQITPASESRPPSKDLMGIINYFREQYTAQKKELVERTAQDLHDGKLDDIRLAEFVLTLQTLRYNIHHLEHDDYPLEELYDLPTVLSEFQEKVREARKKSGVSCDLESLVRLHKFVFNNVINTGYDPNRDSVLSALEGMSQCESGSEGFVLLEDERSGCPDVGLVQFGDHVEIGMVKDREGYAFWAEPNKPPHKYTEGKFFPKEVLVARYLVKEEILLETLPESIQRYFTDDPSLDKANNVPRMSVVDKALTEEPWAAKAAIPTRANKGGVQSGSKKVYWNTRPAASEERQNDAEKGNDLEQCIQKAAVDYAVQTVKRNKFLRVFPDGLTYEQLMSSATDADKDMAEKMYLLSLKTDKQLYVENYVAELSWYVPLNIHDPTFDKKKLEGILKELKRIPGAEKELFLAAQAFAEGLGGKSDNRSTSLRKQFFTAMADSQQPEAAVYLEETVRKGFERNDDNLAVAAFSARTSMKQGEVVKTRGRIPFKILTSEEILEATRLLGNGYFSQMDAIAGTDRENPMHRNIARHILFGEKLEDIGLSPHDIQRIVRYHSEIVSLTSSTNNDPDNPYHDGITKPFSTLIELKDRSSCEDLYGMISFSNPITVEDLFILATIGDLSCEKRSEIYKKINNVVFYDRLSYGHQGEQQPEWFQMFLDLRTAHDPSFSQEEIQPSIMIFNNSPAAQLLHPTAESAERLRVKMLERGPSMGSGGDEFPSGDLLVRLAQIERERSIPFFTGMFKRVEENQNFNDKDRSKIEQKICTAIIYAQNPDLYLNDVRPPTVSSLNGSNGIFEMTFR